MLILFISSIIAMCKDKCFADFSGLPVWGAFSCVCCLTAAWISNS